MNDVFGLPDKDLARVRERMKEAQKENMSISGAEARILQFLIRGFGVRKIVEFGTLFGYSTLAMARALPDDGVIITLEKDEAHHRFAAETFKGMEKKSFALRRRARARAFHRRPRPLRHGFYRRQQSRLRRLFGMGRAQRATWRLNRRRQYFFMGRSFDQPERETTGDNQTRVMKEFNRRLSDPAKYNSTLIPTVEGLTVAQKVVVRTSKKTVDISTVFFELL